MGIDKVSSDHEVQCLQGAGNDLEVLHNQIIDLSEKYANDPGAFKQILENYNKSNESAHNALPKMEIHADCFGFGKVQQVVTRGLDGKKQEIYETPEHRQKEIEENMKQSEPLHIDIPRVIANLNQGEWAASRPDYHTDASVRTGRPEQSMLSGYNIVDHRGSGASVGALNYGELGAFRGSYEDAINLAKQKPKQP